MSALNGFSPPAVLHSGLPTDNLAIAYRRRFRGAGRSHLLSGSGGAGASPAWVTAADFCSRDLPLGEVPVPAAPDVHLWYLDLSVLWQPLSSVMDSAADVARPGPGDLTTRQLRIARRFYLRMLLGAYLGLAGKDVSLIRGARGKPELDVARHGTGLHFSLAKSGSGLLIGISGAAEVGVDLELEHRMPRRANDLARRFFTAREADFIDSLDEKTERDAAFIRTWACKEAVAKASGHGIANRFCRFSIAAAASGPPSVVEDEDLVAGGWQLALVVPERGYIAAVAVQQSALRVSGFRL